MTSETSAAKSGVAATASMTTTATTLRSGL
jgi:hypothetical protein